MSRVLSARLDDEKEKRFARLMKAIEARAGFKVSRSQAAEMALERGFESLEAEYKNELRHIPKE